MNNPNYKGQQRLYNGLRQLKEDGWELNMRVIFDIDEESRHYNPMNKISPYGMRMMEYTLIREYQPELNEAGRTTWFTR